MELKSLIFATQNQNKVNEINNLLSKESNLKIVSLAEFGIFEEIPETADTLEGNARQKAWYIYNKLGANCFSEDTGLEVDALNNAPGVYSARYAGSQKSSADNIAKLLNDLDGNVNRKARFRTLICLILEGKEYIFEGKVEGKISYTASGTSGFGYDPVFVPAGYDKSFAELTLEEKNKISHRAKAIQKLYRYLSVK